MARFHNFAFQVADVLAKPNSEFEKHIVDAEILITTVSYPM